MPSKTYTEEFKRDAVALYQSSLGSSVQEVDRVRFLVPVGRVSGTGCACIGYRG